jgi:hypothetical protein
MMGLMRRALALEAVSQFGSAGKARHVGSSRIGKKISPKQQSPCLAEV